MQIMREGNYITVMFNDSTQVVVPDTYSVRAFMYGDGFEVYFKNETKSFHIYEETELKTAKAKQKALDKFNEEANSI